MSLSSVHPVREADEPHLLPEARVSIQSWERGASVSSLPVVREDASAKIEADESSSGSTVKGLGFFSREMRSLRSGSFFSLERQNTKTELKRFSSCTYKLVKSASGEDGMQADSVSSSVSDTPDAASRQKKDEELAPLLSEQIAKQFRHSFDACILVFFSCIGVGIVFLLLHIGQYMPLQTSSFLLLRDGGGLVSSSDKYCERTEWASRLRGIDYLVTLMLLWALTEGASFWITYQFNPNAVKSFRFVILISPFVWASMLVPVFLATDGNFGSHPTWMMYPAFFLPEAIRLAIRKKNCQRPAKLAKVLFLVAQRALVFYLMGAADVFYVYSTQGQVSVLFEIIIVGFVFPLVQFSARSFALRVANKIILHGRNRKAAELCSIIYFFLEIVLSTPAFFVMFSLDSEVSFYVSLGISFTLEIIGVSANIYLFTNRKLILLRSHISDAYQRRSSIQRRRSSLTETEAPQRMLRKSISAITSVEGQLLKITHLLAVKVANEELGEKVGMLLGGFLLPCVLRDPTPTTFTRMIVSFVLEGCVDIIKNRVCHARGVYTARISFRIDRTMIFETNFFTSVAVFLTLCGVSAKCYY